MDENQDENVITPTRAEFVTLKDTIQTGDTVTLKLFLRNNDFLFTKARNNGIQDFVTYKYYVNDTIKGSLKTDADTAEFKVSFKSELGDEIIVLGLVEVNFSNDQKVDTTFMTNSLYRILE